MVSVGSFSSPYLGSTNHEPLIKNLDSTGSQITTIARVPDRWLLALDRFVGWACAAGLVLVLPISLLLFLQWPLRELVHAGSREANDLAQWLFALYVSLAMTYA